VPNGAQENAIREIGNLENFITVLAFANGVGKTSIVFAILGAIMWGAPSSAFDYTLYKEYPKRWPKRIRIVTESALVSDIGPIQMESAKWWPKGRYAWIKNGKQYNQHCYTDSGFSLEVMTNEQAVKEFEGKTIAINVFIEPPPRAIFNASVARQRMGGINIFDMTPLMSSAWVKDEIVDKPILEVDGKVVGRSLCIHADIEDNCLEHGKNGQLQHNDIQQIISRYDPDELEARAHGKFLHLSGRIFKGFDRSVHVAAEEFFPPANDVSIGMACDPAIAKPLAMLWRYVDADGVLNYYDEYPETVFEGAKDSNLTVTDYAAIIKGREQGRSLASLIATLEQLGVHWVVRPSKKNSVMLELILEIPTRWTRRLKPESARSKNSSGGTKRSRKTPSTVHGFALARSAATSSPHSNDGDATPRTASP